jgi:catechol 2,3-dioxygenase-like lactoylglutathione lyase family enzyme/quercetin dioxygenase-like cupin family protein
MSAVQSASALEHTFAVYDPQGRATPIEYAADFWQRLQRRYGDFAGRTLVSSFAFDSDWPNWEIHPHGDELVCALRGDFDLVLDEPQGLRRVRLAQSGDFAIVPRGTWHTARVHAPSAALFITPGQGTMNHAVDPSAVADHGGDPASPRGAEAGEQPASLDQVNLVCADFDATLRFYRELGLSAREAPPSPDGIRHATAQMPGGIQLEFDNRPLAQLYNAAWRNEVPDGATLATFVLPTRAAVDVIYARLLAAGHRGRQRPFDAFWGARYAIVADPDGRDIGLTSAIDETHRNWPPRPSP